jgi:hypothetical protein
MVDEEQGMRSRILGSFLIAALLPGAAGALDGAPAAAGSAGLTLVPLGQEVYLLQRPDAARPSALVIINDRDVVVFDAGRSAAASEAAVGFIRGITSKPVSVVIDLAAPSDPARSGAVYRREFPGVHVRSPRDELTLFRGPRTIHVTLPDGPGDGKDLVVWLPEAGIVVNRDLVPALSP